MKKAITLFILFIVAVFFLTSCDSGTTPPEPEDPNTGPVINPIEEIEDNFEILEKEIILNFNEEKKLNITKSRDDLELIFASSNLDIVTIDDSGLVKAKGSGVAYITIEMKDGGSDTIKVTVNKPEIEINGLSEMISTETQTLTLSKNYSMVESINWESSDTNIATVDDKGNVSAQIGGIVTISATALTSGAKACFTINITQAYLKPTSIEITSNIQSEVYLDSEIILSAQVLPKGASQDVTWTCANTNRANIEEDGYVNIIKSGKVTFKCSSNEDPNIKASISFDILDYIDPVKFFDRIHIANPLNQQVRAYGFGPIKQADGLMQIDYYTVLAGAVTYLGWDFDWILNENFMVPETNTNPRPGTIREIRYVCVHDTATTHSHTTAYNLANNLKSTSNTTSWHYSVGSGIAFHSIPDNEVAHHAGDGTKNPQVFIDSGVKAIGTEPARITISSDGYFEFTPYYRGKYDTTKKIKSTLEVPEVPIQYYSGGWVTTGYRKAVTADLPNGTGVTNYVGENGNYFISNLHWDSSYQTLANYGGNLNSIGIESTVNYGCDIYRVWMTLAKLIGTKLLPTYRLTLDKVKQHNTFSGKDCPETMRHADLWSYFMKMVEAEYTYYTKLRDFIITFDKGDTNLINEYGQIIKWPDEDTEITYTIHIVKRDGTYEKTLTYTSVIPKKIQNCRLVGSEDPYYYMTLEAREKQLEHAND